jgi:sarcosine oxidase/L-pipecolate oxidase
MPADNPSYSWCFVHIQLSEKEAEEWRNMPVINNRELGYLFEPDVAGRRLKVAPHGVGYTHYVTPGKSYPRARSMHTTDGIPREAKQLVRKLLPECLPDLADRSFGYERLCWDAE